MFLPEINLIKDYKLYNKNTKLGSILETIFIMNDLYLEREKDILLKEFNIPFFKKIINFFNKKEDKTFDEKRINASKDIYVNNINYYSFVDDLETYNNFYFALNNMNNYNRIATNELNISPFENFITCNFNGSVINFDNLKLIIYPNEFIIIDHKKEIILIKSIKALTLDFTFTKNYSNFSFSKIRNFTDSNKVGILSYKNSSKTYYHYESFKEFKNKYQKLKTIKKTPS